MERFKAVLITLALLLSLLPPSGAGAALDLDPRFTALGPLATTTEILSFDHRLSALDLAQVQAVGLRTQSFQTLPMVAVRGPKALVQRLTTMAGLVSLYVDRPLRD